MSLLVIILIAIAIPFLLVTTLVSIGNEETGDPVSRVVRRPGSLLPAFAVAGFVVAGMGTIAIGLLGDRSWSMVAAGVYFVSVAAFHWMTLRSIHRARRSQASRVRWLFVCLAVGSAAIAAWQIADGVRGPLWQMPLAIIPAWLAYAFGRLALRPDRLNVDS